MCRATDSGPRAYAAGVLGTWADRLPDPLRFLRPLVADEHPRVRLQAVVACTYVPKAEAMEVALIAADYPTDKFLTYALNQSVFALKPYWLPAFKTGELKLDHKPSRLNWLVRADGTPDTIQIARDLLQSSRLEMTARETFLRLLTDVGDTNDLAAILRLTDASLQARLLPAVATASRVRNVRPAGDLTAALHLVFESQNGELHAEALKLAGLWRIEAFRPRVEAVALDRNATEKARGAAVESLATFGGEASQKTLSLLASESAPWVQGAAIAALCAFDLNSAARFASESFDRLNDEAILGEIFSAFLRRKGGAAALATALGAKPPPKLAAEVGLRLMSASDRHHEHLARILTYAAGLNSSENRMTLAEATAVAAEARTSGDAKRGAEIFRRAELGCTACHPVNGQGGIIGPDLSALGTAQPVDLIVRLRPGSLPL